MKKIPLSQGLFAVVDDEDFCFLNQWKWTAKKQGQTYYAYTPIVRPNGKRTTITMHCLLMGYFPNKEVDHINHDGFDNRRSNLRFVSKRENAQNRRKEGTSRYPGVSWNDYKWRADISCNGKQVRLGVFDTEEEAYKEYRRAEKEIEETGALSRPRIRKPSSKYLGVFWNKRSKKWQANTLKTPTQDKRRLGVFVSEEDAFAAVCSAMRDLGVDLGRDGTVLEVRSVE